MPFRNSFCWAVLLLLILTACHRTEVEIPFETIQHARDTGHYTGKKPDIMVITQTKQVEEAGNLVYIKDKEKLVRVDYSDHIGVILFHGAKPHGSFRIEVKRVTYDGRYIHIYTVFHEPGEDDVLIFEDSSTSHIIKVEKPVGIESNLWTTFILYDKRQEVARRRVAIPKMDGPSSVTSPLSPLESNEQEENKAGEI